MSEAMQQQFGLILRPWGVYYLKNKVTGEQTSLKTRDKQEAQRLLQANNDTEMAFQAACSVMRDGRVRSFRRREIGRGHQH